MSEPFSSCFLEKIRNLKRGGVDLVAESDSLFSREVFVFHPEDVKFLQKLKDLPRDSPFVIMILGVPGVGKTALLLTLLRDERTLPERIRNNALWKEVRQMYNFMDLGTPLLSEKKRISNKRNVWIVPTVDEYYSPSAGSKMTGLLNDLARYVKQDDSVILAGNMGMFATQHGERDPRNKIKDIIAEKSKAKSFSSIILEPWIKEYGNDPTSAEAKESFKEFSKETIEFIAKFLMRCYSGNCTRDEKQICIKLQGKLQETIKLICEETFLERIYDLVCSIRLRHRDIYLTPRTLLVFWADFCSNLLLRLQSRTEVTIYQAIFESCLISSLYAKSYKLQETNLDIFRSQEIDEILIKKYSNTLENSSKRKACRLKIYFENEVKNPRGMIYDGAYDDFINQQGSANVLKKVFHYFFVYADKRFQRKLTDPERIVEGEEWLLYTFLIESWMRTKKEFITNMGAIEDFIDKYSPVIVEPIDFNRRSRKVELNLKEPESRKPHFYVDVETFLPFLMLSKGFYVDFTLYPSILAKIEIVLLELRDIFRPFLLKWFEKHINEPERIKHTYISEDGLLIKEETPWR